MEASAAQDPTQDPQTPAKDDDHGAGRRAREVYRYFRPERLAAIDEYPTPGSEGGSSLGHPQFTDSASASVRSPSASPQPSPTPLLPQEEAAATAKPLPGSLVLGEYNDALTSLAQLAALRLDVDRAFISVSDRDSQFIIAQSGKSTEDDIDQPKCSTLDLSDWDMCQDTVALPSSDLARDEYNFLVSSDLSQDERYQTLSIVQKNPNFRFYAGTPLTTESNINVGCLFVLDSKPHAEFTKSERAIMGHMGSLVVDFLKISRQASEGRRAARLSRGLNYFVDGGSTFNNATSTISSPVSDLAQRRYSHASSGKSSSRRSSASRQKTRSTSSRRSCSSGSARSPSLASDKNDQFMSSSFDGSVSGQSSSLSQPVENKQSNSWTFRRAANLIRESLELESDSGVAFLEASCDAMLDRWSDSDVSSSQDIGKAASLLAISIPDSPFGPDGDSAVSRPVAKLDEDFLHRLLNTYQQGKIWSLHRDGQQSSSDSEDSSPSREGRPRSRAQMGSKAPKKWKLRETAMLNRYFPGATQVLFVPLWNAANSQWFGGCFCWNNIESKVFDPAVELSSLSGFGSSIMAECNRVESLISDRQKADFLSSISHELRSPLHGIMAASEILQGTNLNAYQCSLMDTINACGRTLLDTMNQVLDFSKIISLEKKFQHLERRKVSPLELKNRHRSAAHLDAHVATDISLLAEEVVEGVSLGHFHSQNSTDSSALLAAATKANEGTLDTNIPRPNVDVLIDIAPNDWTYHVPPGALRRIIMNIFSNAIKYTEAGQVHLQLEAKEASENCFSRPGYKEHMVTLTVSDTGKGISEDFLKSKLFVPFAQEDSLATGSGLGLSIVRSLVKTMSGSINVNSRPGKGTSVKVTLPLARSEPEDIESQSEPMSPSACERWPVKSELHHLREAHGGKRVAIMNVEPEDAPNHQSWANLSRYLTDWYGLILVSPSSQESIDLILSDKVPSQSEMECCFTGKNAAFLMLSSNYIGRNSISLQWPTGSKIVDIINPPCGPHKLARFIQRCLDKDTKHETIETLSLAEPLAKLDLDEDSSSGNESQESELQSSSATPSEDSHPSSTPNTETTDTDCSEEPRKARILVVEDNKINLNLMLAFLKKFDLGTVDTAENGSLAVSAVKQDQQGFDFIFMDISMPIMDGFEAARSIRAFEKSRLNNMKPSKIIALTGLSSSHDESEAMNSGIDRFMTKPVSFKEVKKILDQWIEAEVQDQGQSQSSGTDSTSGEPA
ncbi:uncharacterized protein N7477_006880 [Penicillium maclennaniae]|uniref:uncharacterized protein n=1 Tax=Penicillium maclennaniae TaxID=1343394 RepID=UPI002541693D|nr:uncharacterized protein N7477_006880 [Penicillium maclennaniae]KAJ5668310.1 hypothetical protein N7477_006880 [Penicillium maclennaniae]